VSDTLNFLLFELNNAVHESGFLLAYTELIFCKSIR